ncbi:MAG: IPT/TIG domain-containing protein [Chloroflexi bacterium]|nr:IPT/TIG domain-containing protein [Chloroflexota bacterium]
MKFQTKFFTSITLASIILAGWITPVYANPIISSVSPNLVFNDTATTITVTGSGFVSGAVVSLNNYGALTTSFDSPTQLRAVVRPGVPAGTYAVVVTNPDSTTSQLVNGLTIADPSPLPTATPIPFNRPQMVVSSYEINRARVSAGGDFKLSIDFANAGTATALNVQAVFTSPDLIPTETGGVIALDSELLPGHHSDAVQKFYALSSVYGKTVISIEATVTYYDTDGTVYTDKFTLSIPADGSTNDAYPTSTPTGVNSAQLVIASYAATVNPLQPGEQFQLGLTVQNMGNTAAKHVTMIVGGGSAGNSGETPQPGGVSGSGGEFTNFAPLNSSNIQSLGDIPAGGAMQVLQDLIVNVSTSPGAYPMKISFSYVNNKGEVINDDQVITLLVYRLPNVDVSFYRPLDPIFAGQPAALPIQIVNLGKNSTVLGNMKIEVEGGTLDPASTLVGSLDPGGYFTFDSTLFADAPGDLNLTITIEYTDDFNQARTLTRKLNVTVEESFVDPGIDPSMGGGGGEMPPIIEEESFLHKIWRAILGFLGLDSAPPTNEIPGGEMMPGEEMIPIPPSGG